MTERKLCLAAEGEDQPRDRHAALGAEIGRRLRICRHRQGLSLREVAEQVGISIHQAGKYETGLSMISASMLYAFCRALGMAVPDLLAGMDDDAAPAPSWPAGPPRPGDRDALERMALMDHFDRIEDKALRRLLLKTVQRMAEIGQ